MPGQVLPVAWGKIEIFLTGLHFRLPDCYNGCMNAIERCRIDSFKHMATLIADFRVEDSKWRASGPGIPTYRTAARAAAFHMLMGALTAYTRCGIFTYDEYKTLWQPLYDQYFTDENTADMAEMAVEDFLQRMA